MSGEENFNLEAILKHLMGPLNERLDKIDKRLEKLQDHQVLVPQLVEKVEKLEKLEIRVLDLENDKKHRDEMKHSITNPILKNTIWGIICLIVFSVGVAWRSIDHESTKEMAHLIGPHAH